VGIAGAALWTVFVVAVVPLAPTEPVLTAAAVLDVVGKRSLAPLVLVAAVGCSISDHLLYGAGRFAGGAVLLDRLGRRKGAAAALEWLTRNSARWGPQVLVAGRWLPAGGTVGSLLAGALRWKLVRFTPTSLTGSTLWTVYVVLIGYLGGTVAGNPLVGIGVSFGIAAVLGAATSLIVKFNHRRRLARDLSAIP
jgi:membrane protein DedA with SNARE-associated domain